MSTLLTTTGDISSIILNDLGKRIINHPTTDLILSDEYSVEEIANSYDLQSAIDNDYVIVIDDGNVVSDLESQIVIGPQGPEALQVPTAHKVT